MFTTASFAKVTYINLDSSKNQRALNATAPTPGEHKTEVTFINDSDTEATIDGFDPLDFYVRLQPGDIAKLYSDTKVANIINIYLQIGFSASYQLQMPNHGTLRVKEYIPKQPK